MTKTYTNGEITVIWKPNLCRHTGICARGLPSVFDPGRRPWIEMNQSTTEQIAAQVDKCPSKALTWVRNRADG